LASFPAVRIDKEENWNKAKLHASAAYKLGMKAAQAQEQDTDRKALDYYEYSKSKGMDTAILEAKQSLLTAAEQTQKKAFLSACEQQYLNKQPDLSPEMKAAVRSILDQVEPKSLVNLGPEPNKIHDDSDSDADANTNSNTDADANTNPDSNTNADADTDTDADAHAHTNANTNADTDTDTYADSNTNANADTDADSNTDADPNTNPDSNVNPDSNTDPYPDPISRGADKPYSYRRVTYSGQSLLDCQFD